MAWLKQATVAGVVCLAGCGTIADLGGARITDANPVEWWHSLEGGAIAEQRPPPPGADDPYPNLSTVPARPVPTTQAQRVALTAQLTAERDGVRRDVAREPLVAMAAPAPAAKKADPATVPPPDATIEAATAPPPAVTSPAVTPPAVTAPAIATPAVNATPALLPDRVPVPPRKQTGRVAQPSGPMPDLPTGPPPTPVLPGIPAATFAPATKRPLPAYAIVFAPGADQLPADAAAGLRTLADRRGGGPVLVYAGGDASGAGAAQGPALDLALRRAGAIGRALAAAGVPPAQTRTEATAAGRDSGARLVE